MYFRWGLGVIITALLWWCGLASPLQAAPMTPVMAGPSPPSVQFLPSGATGTQPMSHKRFKDLFYRQPWSFDLQTFAQVGQDLQQWNEKRSKTLDWFQSWLANQSLVVWFLWFLTAVMGMALSFHLRRRLTHWQQQEQPRTWLSPISDVSVLLLARSIPWLFLLFLNQLLTGFFPGLQGFPLLTGFLWLGLGYQVGKTGLGYVWLELGDLLFPRLVPAIRRHYLRLSCRLLLVVVWVQGGIYGLSFMGYNPAFIEFLSFILTLFCFTLGLAFMTRKKAIFALLPEVDDPFYVRLIKGLDQFYSYALGFTLVLVFLWLMGFQNLSHLLFVRSWVLFALGLGAVALYRWMVQRWGSDAEHTTAAKLNWELFCLGILVEVLALLYLVLSLLDLYQSLIMVLSFPLVAIGKSQMSVLSILQGMLVFWLFLSGARIGTLVLDKHFYINFQWDVSITHMLNTTIHYFMWTFGILMALSASGLDLSILAIFAGALGVGIGFGLQDIAKNFVSGLVLIFGRLVKKGDYISMGVHSGYVQDVDWKRVHLKTTESLDLIVPTAHFVGSAIVNWTYSDTLVRVHLPVDVDYQSDPTLVKQLLLQAASGHDMVLDKPAPNVWLVEFGPNGLKFELLVWVDYRQIIENQLKGELNFMIWELLRQNHIEIALPQRDLHLRTWPEKSDRPELPSRGEPG